MLSKNLADRFSAEEEPRPSAGRASQNQKYTSGCVGANGNRQAQVTKIPYFPKRDEWQDDFTACGKVGKQTPRRPKRLLKKFS